MFSFKKKHVPTYESYSAPFFFGHPGVGNHTFIIVKAMRHETDGGLNNATRYRRSCSDIKKSPLPSRKRKSPAKIAPVRNLSKYQARLVINFVTPLYPLCCGRPVASLSVLAGRWRLYLYARGVSFEGLGPSGFTAARGSSTHGQFLLQSNKLKRYLGCKMHDPFESNLCKLRVVLRSRLLSHGWY